VLRSLENVGVSFEVTGLDNIRRLGGPAVFIGNHMSALETFVLPCLIQPLRPFTFIVKSELVHIPVYRSLVRYGNPIVLGRKNPREDLRLALEAGAERLRQGVSIAVFPQHTRASVFSAEDFNSLGVKLASRAGVPALPFALKTDAWGIGKRLRDFGPLDPSRKVCFAFGEPFSVNGNGPAANMLITDFIQRKLAGWNRG
jgi:1-acyl-sn-glycerol-3-phosphate acyltransferase